MRKPPPSRQTRSIVVGVGDALSPSIRSDSSVKGRARRLAMKPGLSLARIGVRPMRVPTSVVVSSASGEESAVATTSTSFISAGGLKKCMPTMRSGPGTPAAIAVTGSEDVLLARIASGLQATASAAKSSRFSPRSSGAASITRSHSARSPMLCGGADAGAGARRRPLRSRGPSWPPSRGRGGGGRCAGLERLGHRVVQAGLIAAERGDLGDAGAHRAGADDPHATDVDLHRPSNLGSRFSRKACIPSTRSSVAIASS